MPRHFWRRTVPLLDLQRRISALKAWRSFCNSWSLCAVLPEHCFLSLIMSCYGMLIQLFSISEVLFVPSFKFQSWSQVCGCQFGCHHLPCQCRIHEGCLQHAGNSGFNVQCPLRMGHAAGAPRPDSWDCFGAPQKGDWGRADEAQRQPSEWSGHSLQEAWGSPRWTPNESMGPIGDPQDIHFNFTMVRQPSCFGGPGWAMRTHQNQRLCGFRSGIPAAGGCCEGRAVACSSLVGSLS